MKKYVRLFRAIISSLYINFHYLPFSQAIKLPILLYKPTYSKLKGKIVIHGRISFGMIRMGFPTVSIYPNSGINLEIKGGTLVFMGVCHIGNGSAISVSENGILEIGDFFSATTTFKCACHYHIKIEDYVLCGWETMIVDTDFHKLCVSTGIKHCPYEFVKIGHNSWLGMKTVILKGTQIPPYTVVGAHSVCNKVYSIPEKTLIVGQPAVLKKTGIYLDRSNMNIEYDFSNRHNEK